MRWRQASMEMVSRSYVTHGAQLVKQGRLPIAAVDEAVRRVLRIKLRAGLFDRPYADEAREQDVLLAPKFRQAARTIAARSMVLLKNDAKVLPLSPAVKRLAVIGPLADDRANVLGNWIGDGRQEDVLTILEGIKAAVTPQTAVVHARGVRLDVADFMPGKSHNEAADDAGIEEAVRLAQSADVA